MATVTSPGRQGGMQALLADIMRRLKRLENPTLLTTGQYRIYQDATGNLVAEHVPTGEIQVLMAKPEPV